MLLIYCKNAAIVDIVKKIVIKISNNRKIIRNNRKIINMNFINQIKDLNTIFNPLQARLKELC